MITLGLGQRRRRPGRAIFNIVTGWMVDRWPFHPVFAVFSVLPWIAAAGIWMLPGIDPTA
jgi:hypothetical protein